MISNPSSLTLFGSVHPVALAAIRQTPTVELGRLRRGNRYVASIHLLGIGQSTK
jgi:hypothetical protein